MKYLSVKINRLFAPLVVAAGLALGAAAASAQINVLTVDCAPFVSPGGSSFGLQNTMGQALVAADTGGLFNVTEDTPADFRSRSAADLSGFGLIAVNNHPTRLGDNCIVGLGTGLGTTWHSVVGVVSGGRVLLTSHDAPRFHMNVNVLPNSTRISSICPGCEPFGAVQLVRDAALWAGGVPGKTGLLVFNDARTFVGVGGSGWSNPELNLPPAWDIADSGPQVTFFPDGGYTQILGGFVDHPVYANVNDLRLEPNSISSFAATIGDGSFHSIFGSFDPTIFTVTEVVINALITDPGNFGCCSFDAASGPDGTAITLIRDDEVAAALDHFACYKVKEKTKLGKLTVSLSDQFTVDDEAQVKKAKEICAPVDKNGEGIVNQAVHLVCYDVKPKSGKSSKKIKQRVLVTNQFGEQVLEVKERKRLCVPSTKELIQ